MAKEKEQKAAEVAELRKQLAISVWREGAVAHTFDEKSVASNLQKLPCGAHTC